MVGYLILGVAALLAGLLLVRAFATANPATLARVIQWLIPAIASAIGIFLLVTGRPVFAVLALLVFLIALIRQLRGAAPAGGWGPSRKGKGASEVETRYLRMTLDHETGAMTGTVLSGPFEGRRVEDLGFEDLLELLRVCRAEDEQSAQILETYLDRAHEDWRERAGEEGKAGAAGAGGAMTREEAYDILGLKPGANEKEIREAHRKQMAKHHPDHGGSTYIAAKLNEAKELLLGG